MNVFFAAESRPDQNGTFLKMSVRHGLLTALLLGGMVGISLPALEVAAADDGAIGMRTTMSMQQSEEPVRTRTARRSVAGEEDSTQSEAMSTEQEEEGEVRSRTRTRGNVEEVAEGEVATTEQDEDAVRSRTDVRTARDGTREGETTRMGQAAEDAELRALQQRVVAQAMTTAPEDWSDELKELIVQTGWDLEEFTAGIRQRQQDAGDTSNLLDQLLALQADTDSVVSTRTWGQIKADTVAR